MAAPHSLPFLLLLLLLVFTVLTQAANPFNTLWPTDTLKTQITEQTLAVVSIVLQTIILMGLILLTIRKWHLPFGFLTLVFTLNAMALSVMHNHYIIILIAALAGVIADVIYLRLQPSMARVGEFRLFACLVPGVLYLVYFLVLLVTSHIVWSVHLAVGSIILAGITGWLLSYLFVPLRDSM